MNTEKFGPFLRWLRGYWQMPTEYLAERLSVSPDVVTAWEEGRAYPTEEQLLALSDIFFLSVADLKACVLPTAPGPVPPQQTPPVTPVPPMPSVPPQDSSRDGSLYGSMPSEEAPQEKAPKKKRMTPGKWVAIFVPAGILTLVLFILMPIGITFGALEAVKNNEQYRVAYNYLVNSETFRTNEEADEEVELIGYHSNYSEGTTHYELVFETDDYVYVIYVRKADNILVVEEEYCYYYDEDLREAEYLPISGSLAW